MKKILKAAYPGFWFLQKIYMVLRSILVTASPGKIVHFILGINGFFRHLFHNLVTNSSYQIQKPSIYETILAG
ncbi:MAG TPA: hypothetical protein DDX98_06725 [Bacteroidales bacterium]|nr:hypothetical protein [Bacteroidales bacterium]